ncbi:DoxX family protein [Myxococcus sp. AM009]|uniref:DoxX family protein n=1 Tax=unclassified Myxococcus TaxID=2648731 RepID=UPI00159588AE|nr:MULTISPECIES: DoxX family protein [unclassified Myxococcus]NVI98580.1 DoxX family protein [Myxococcus sp. AM009]NVJ15204.1 DoxX family protein [Myxococcus sp. AM010]
MTTTTHTELQHAAPAPRPQSGTQSSSRKALWTGRVLSGIAVLFLLFDATGKLLQIPEAQKGTVELGYPVSVLFGLGVVQLVCLAVYLIPRVSVLGAILWTGYLGGAVATHVRVGNPLFSHMLFPVYIATLLWLGLWLRDSRLRAVLPGRATSP